jgi:hypothetical protein
MYTYVYLYTKLSLTKLGFSVKFDRNGFIKSTPAVNTDNYVRPIIL